MSFVCKTERSLGLRPKVVSVRKLRRLASSTLDHEIYGTARQSHILQFFVAQSHQALSSVVVLKPLWNGAQQSVYMKHDFSLCTIRFMPIMIDEMRNLLIANAALVRFIGN